ncbi:PAS domain-containing protein [Bradyrhizobium erythrophlei]|uniref:PAS domain-containing protein n=1 Tax=Bradyrhizobium erythrophlei TaxID=1437360 RepID=UPI0035EE5941
MAASGGDIPIPSQSRQGTPGLFARSLRNSYRHPEMRQALRVFGMDQHAIIIANADGVIQLWSAGAVSLFGHDAANAVGRKLDLVIPQEFRDLHWKGFGHAMKMAAVNGEGAFFDIPGLCNGEVRTLRGQLHVLRDEGKAAIGAMAIFTPKGA